MSEHLLSNAVRRWTECVLGQPVAWSLLLAVNLVAYITGALFWYGYALVEPGTPAWAWPFIPDCPLFGLLGALALWSATAHATIDEAGQRRIGQALMGTGALCLLLVTASALPGAPSALIRLRATLALLALSLLLLGWRFGHAPSWLLGVIAVGQIKYGLWTITAWVLFWRNTALIHGAPLWTVESVSMTAMHVGLLTQGVLLLAFVRPTLNGAWVALVWFAASDFVDYGLGFHPRLTELIPVATMAQSTVLMTLLLGGWYAWRARRRLHSPFA